MSDPAPSIPLRVPPALRRSLERFFGPAWVEALPEPAARRLHHWNLRLTGAPMHGLVALVLPVELPDGTSAMLKLQPVDEESARAWTLVRVLGQGRGALLEGATALPEVPRVIARALGR